MRGWGGGGGGRGGQGQGFGLRIKTLAYVVSNFVQKYSLLLYTSPAIKLE